MIRVTLAYLAIALTVALSLTGCLEKDEAITLYIEEDGSIEMVVYRDQLRSTESDPAKRKKSHDEWLAEARNADSSELRHLKESGAKDIRHEILRDRPPFVEVLAARFPTPEAYARHAGLRGGEDDAKLSFTRTGRTRAFVIEVPAQKKSKEDQAAAKKGDDKPSEQYPTYKIVPVGGTITKARLFKPSKNKDSALLDFSEVDRLDKKGKPYELRLEWTL